MKGFTDAIESIIKRNPRVGTFQNLVTAIGLDIRYRLKNNESEFFFYFPSAKDTVPDYEHQMSIPSYWVNHYRKYADTEMALIFYFIFTAETRALCEMCIADDRMRKWHIKVKTC